MARPKECPIAPYEKDRDFDRLFELFVNGAYKACLEKDKSATILCAGDVGSGKSTLMFWAYILVDPEPDVRRIGFNTKTFAQAMGEIRGKKAPFLAHDEFNLNSRNAMQEGNKDFIDLLFSVRGENWFFWANNPSVQSIDKQVLTEGLVNLVFFVHKEQEKYLLFTRKGLLDLIKEHRDASFYNLKTHGAKFAVYEGWFRKYNGDLWKEYSRMKKERMSEKIENYVNKYSQGTLVSMNMAANRLNVSWGTVRKAFTWGCKEGDMEETTHFVVSGTGKPQLTETGFEELKVIVGEQLYVTR